jgi:hypothetical protein
MNKLFAVLCIGSLFIASCKTSNEIPEPPVGKVEILSFMAMPSTISLGGSAKLSWNVSGVSTAAIDNGIGTVQAKGEVSVSPKATTTYTLIAGVLPDRVQASATVIVNSAPPVLGHAEIRSFKASDYDLPVNGSSRISWEVVNAVTVKISGEGTVALSGYFDRKFEYTEKVEIEATGADGKAVKEMLTVSVDRRTACEWFGKGSYGWSYPNKFACKVTTNKNGSPYYTARNVTFKLVLYDNLNNIIDGGTGSIAAILPGQSGECIIDLPNGKGGLADHVDMSLIRCDCDFK